MEYYKQYLFGHHFRVRSDHEALKWLFSMKEPKHCIAQWIEVLPEFISELEYHSGKKHGNADALSRCPNPRDCSCSIAEEHELWSKSCKKCLRKAEIMLGTLPDQVCQPLEVTSKTARTMQMCSQAWNIANNPLWLEAARGTVMHVNHLPPPVEVLGGNILVILDGAGGTDISGVVRPQISQPTLKHGYFTQFQNRRQDDAVKTITGKKCPSDTPMPKPNTGPSNKVKKQMTAALDGGQSVPSQKKSGRGWTNKAQVQDGIACTNDTNAPSNLKSGGGSKGSNAQVGWGLSLNPAVLCKKQLDDPDIGPILKWKESGQRPFGPEVCASSHATRHYWNCWALLQIQEGLLMCHSVRCDVMGEHLQLCNEILHHVHD